LCLSSLFVLVLYFWACFCVYHSVFYFLELDIEFLVNLIPFFENSTTHITQHRGMTPNISH
jgi:hypothetical protein